MSLILTNVNLKIETKGPVKQTTHEYIYVICSSNEIFFKNQYSAGADRAIISIVCTKPGTVLVFELLDRYDRLPAVLLIRFLYFPVHRNRF